MTARPAGLDEAYFVLPPGDARATVVVLHAWWGLTQVITSVCDELAAAGYAAVAPDLYHGERASTPEQARALRERRRSTPVWRQIVASAEAAVAASGACALGQIGFSMGGHWALWLASRSKPEVPAIAATVCYYAVRACDFAHSDSAFQFHLAESDPFVPGSGVLRQRKALERAGREHEFHVYPGTGHWFFERDRPDAYDAAAAALSWRRTVGFLDAHLPG